MKFSVAKICLECGEIFPKVRKKRCPACGKYLWMYVSTFLPDPTEDRDLYVTPDDVKPVAVSPLMVIKAALQSVRRIGKTTA